jgi:hypothetical protein
MAHSADTGLTAAILRFAAVKKTIAKAKKRLAISAVPR